MKTGSQKLFVFLIAFTTLFTACKTTKVGKTQHGKAGVERINQAIASQFQYDYFTSKGDIEIVTGTNRISSKSELRMVKDEAIQLSAQPILGIEVARLGLTTDTLIILDRMGKQYVAESLTPVKSLLPKELNLETLQALLTNQLFTANDKKLQASDFTRKEEGNSLLLGTKGKIVNFEFTLNPEARLTQTNVLTKNGSVIASCSYHDFKRIGDGQLFPHQIKISFVLKGKPCELKFRFANLNMSKKPEINLNVPGKYKQLKVDDLLKMILKN